MTAGQNIPNAEKPMAPTKLMTPPIDGMMAASKTEMMQCLMLISRFVKKKIQIFYC